MLHLTRNRMNSMPNVTLYSGDCGRSTVTMLETLSAKVQNELTNLEVVLLSDVLSDTFPCCSSWIWRSFSMTFLASKVSCRRDFSFSSRFMALSRCWDFAQASCAGA